MSEKNPVTVAELSEKIVRSYGFFCLVNEGKKISVITDHERSMDMIVDYLMAHPHVIEEVLQKIASYNASLN
jgi:membrane-bound lytic murein transglycosylase